MEAIRKASPFNIIKRCSVGLVLPFCLIVSSLYAQDSQSPPLNLGDQAPALRVSEWIKGTPVQQFQKGKMYVLEFWATWCRPCIASMPHLSALSRKYKDKVTVIAIDIYESKLRPAKSAKQVKAFVDSMGNGMDFNVAIEDSNFMEKRWIDATGERGIPKSFVVDTKGRLAWIGHPKDLDTVLPKVINKSWDIGQELAKRNENKRLARLDDSLNYELNNYAGNTLTNDFGQLDSALIAIKEIIRKEPKLKYAPFIGAHTFTSLLKTNPHKAYEFGQILIITPTYDDPPYHLIISSIEMYSDKLNNLPSEIYDLGAAAYQMEIDQYGKFGNMNIPNDYMKMAEMYRRANNKLKAIDAMQKAIEALQSKKNFSKKEMAAFESRLQQYKKS